MAINPQERVRRKFGISSPPVGVLGQLGEGVEATSQGAAAQTQLGQLGQSGGQLGSDGGGFLQKFLQILMNPAVQRTAGAVGSAVAGPRELGAFQRQSALQSGQEDLRQHQELARKREKRERETFEFNRSQALEKATLAQKKQRVDSGKALADLTSKGFDPTASADILGVTDPFVIESAGKFKPNVRYIDSSTGKLLKSPSENSIGPFSPGEAFKLGMDIKKFNRGEKLASPIGQMIEDLNLLRSRVQKARDGGATAKDLIPIFNEMDVLESRILLTGSSELERMVSAFPKDQQQEIMQRLVLSRMQGTQRAVFGPDGNIIFAEGSDLSQVFDLTEKRDARKEVDNAVALLRDTKMLREVLTPFTVGPVASIAGTVAGLAEPFAALTGSSEVQSYIAGVVEDIQARGEDISRDGKRIDLKLFDPKRPIAQALMRAIAYKLARLNDPSGGRLSDFDVENAIELLTGGQPITSPFGILGALEVIEDQARFKINRFAPRFGSTMEQELGDLQEAPSQGSDLINAYSTIVNDPSVDQATRDRVLQLLEQQLAQ